jgi:hypothetical protein
MHMRRQGGKEGTMGKYDSNHRQFLPSRAESGVVVAASAPLLRLSPLRGNYVVSRERARDMLSYMEVVINACFRDTFDLGSFCFFLVITTAILVFELY